MDLAEIEALLSRGDDIHCTRLRVVCLENTHNYTGKHKIPGFRRSIMSPFCFPLTERPPPQAGRC